MSANTWFYLIMFFIGLVFDIRMIFVLIVVFFISTIIFIIKKVPKELETLRARRAGKKPVSADEKINDEDVI